MEGDEEKLLHSVALQNANSIFLARQRADQELVRTKEALEAKTQALVQSLERAEALARERDRALVEADKAKRAAQAASDAKGRFLSMISHELRTPLGAIAGYVDLLEEGIHGALSDGQREYIERIHHNQKHILRLVDELLDLAKIESGQFVLHLDTVPLQPVLESVHTMIEPQMQASQLRFEIRSDDPTLRFHADGKRVEQIVLNLLSNAVKFTPAGGSVTITTAPTGDKVSLHVQDTGVGIPPGKLQAVFEPFVQVESSRPPQPRAGRGTGLGLAISRELARVMGGELTVTSERGKGSRFTLSLPRAN
jgi:signal transduction histidine kinase